MAEPKYRPQDFKVGMAVKHSKGFIGEVVSIGSIPELVIKITDHGTLNQFNRDLHPLGYRYFAKAENVTEIISDPAASTSNKLTIDVEVNGLNELIEQLTDVEGVLEGITSEAEFLADLKKEESVFKVELGEGVKFEGTKTDYEAFVKGFKELLKIGVQFR